MFPCRPSSAYNQVQSDSRGLSGVNHLEVNVWELQARLILCQLGAFSGSATMERSSYEAFPKAILVGCIFQRAIRHFVLSDPI